MKVLTVLGTRPEIIRLSLVIEKLDRLCDHVLVHTGQNFDPRLSDVFFEELSVRAPDHYLGAAGATFGEQVGKILAGMETVLRAERPDRLLILGDTNSGLSALVAKRLGIPVFHMEAGNRCYDDRVPEETNRRVIDHSSDVLLPYTERSRDNLVREGVAAERVYVTGNPINEVLLRHEARIAGSAALRTLGLSPRGYLLVTMHRAENVDVEPRLLALTAALGALHRDYGVPVVCSLHPRTRSRLRDFGIGEDAPGIHFVEPLGFFDFVALERDALCVLSDSGTVQEECCIFRVPNVTLRDVTERPETVECGSNILSGVEPASVAACVRAALARPPAWVPPREYLATNVSDVVVRLLLGYRLPPRGAGWGATAGGAVDAPGGPARLPLARAPRA
jgi:UDP-N-acetylglucosamine 2-epimerase (non-hydrolysing)